MPDRAWSQLSWTTGTDRGQSHLPGTVSTSNIEKDKDTVVWQTKNVLSTHRNVSRSCSTATISSKMTSPSFSSPFWSTPTLPAYRYSFITPVNTHVPKLHYSSPAALSEQNGKIDMTFFTHDCFHFTIKGHEELAKGLWNNMVNARNAISQRWNLSIDPIIFFSLSVFLLVPAWGRKDDREQFFWPHHAHLSTDGRKTAAAEPSAKLLGVQTHTCGMQGVWRQHVLCLLFLTGTPVYLHPATLSQVSSAPSAARGSLARHCRLHGLPPHGVGLLRACLGSMSPDFLRARDDPPRCVSRFAATVCDGVATWRENPATWINPLRLGGHLQPSVCGKICGQFSIYSKIIKSTSLTHYNL